MRKDVIPIIRYGSEYFFTFNFMNVYVFVCVNVSTCGGWKRALDPLELELQELWAVQHGCWKSVSSSLEEQQVLLATHPFLQCTE